MTRYDLLLRASVAERAAVTWRFERGRKTWHDSIIIALAAAAAGLAAVALAYLRGDNLRLALDLGVIGAVVAQIVVIAAGRMRSRKYIAGLSGSALQQAPTPVTLGPEGITFAARHFDWSDFRAAQRVDGMTLLAASDFDGLVVRDQDLSSDLTPEQLQTLLSEWKSR